MESFHENLRYYREKVGYSTKKIAELLGISANTYAGYEIRGREPKYEMLVKIADLLQVSTDDLLGRNEPPSKDKSLKIINKVRHKINRQKEQWGDEKHLSPHQWLGLIAEEIGEMTEAVNETYLPNRTKEHLGGIEHIQEEAIQAMALMVRFLESINEEQTND